MFEQLQTLAGSQEPWAAERARMAMDIVMLRESGELSDSEAKELLLDLVRMDRLDAEASNLETKTMLVQAIYVAAKLV
jgi:hypothetical protein